MHIHFRSSFTKKKKICQWWGHSDVELVPGLLGHCQNIKRSLDSLPKARCPFFIIFQLCTQMLANFHGQNDGSGIGKTTDVYWRTTKGINLWFLNAHTEYRLSGEECEHTQAEDSVSTYALPYQDRIERPLPTFTVHSNNLPSCIYFYVCPIFKR